MRYFFIDDYLEMCYFGIKEVIITKDRIKKIRKTLRLTQQDFASRIGSVQNTITGYETGRRVPSNQVIALICREFGINEEWLRTGDGGDENMFAPNVSSSLDELADAHGLTGDQRVLIEKFIELTPEDRKKVLDYVMEVARSISGYDEAEDLHAELDRQIELEKEPEEKSGVS